VISTLLLDPHADQIVDANPAACALLGYDRALLRQTRISALHAGQLPALMPGYAEGSTHIHHLHAYAAAVAAVVLFGIGWFSGRR